MRMSWTLMIEFDKSLTDAEREQVKENVSALIDRGVAEGLFTDGTNLDFEGFVLTHPTTLD